MKILLYKVVPISGGEETELYFELSAGENFERSKLTVSAEMFFELGFSVGAAETEVSRENYEYVTFLAEKHAAVKKGVSILAFGDNTKRNLAAKLRTKGFSRAASEEACDFLESAGYINEAENAKMLARDMAEKKLYGMKRINAALYEKGFTKEAVSVALEDIDVDFASICRARIEKMGGREIFASRETKQKSVAALLRYGFSYSDIKEAINMKKKP